MVLDRTLTLNKVRVARSRSSVVPYNMSDTPSKRKKPVHFSASPSPDAGLTFRLKPHTPSETKVVLENETGDYVA